MADPNTTPKSGSAGKRSPYQEFLLQLEEIQTHKWIESEKLQRDLGFEEALVDWMKNHRADWREKWQP